MFNLHVSKLMRFGLVGSRLWITDDYYMDVEGIPHSCTQVLSFLGEVIVALISPLNSDAEFLWFKSSSLYFSLNPNLAFRISELMRCLHIFTGPLDYCS